jgi:hypothetical protein
MGPALYCAGSAARSARGEAKGLATPYWSCGDGVGCRLYLAYSKDVVAQNDWVTPWRCVGSWS